MNGTSRVVRYLVLAVATLGLTVATAAAQTMSILAPGPTEPLYENGTYVFLVTISGDPDGSAVLSVSGTNASLVTADSISIVGTGSSRAVVYRPPFDTSGTTDLTITLSDPAPLQTYTVNGLVVQAATAVPRAITNPVATDDANGVSWTAASLGGESDLPSYYLLEVGDAPGLTAFEPFRIPARTSSVTLNLPRAGYTFRLRPGNRLGLGPVSAEGSVGLVNAPAVPGPPSGVSISLSASNVATATWAPPGFGAAPLFYVIEVGTSAGASDVGTFAVPPTLSASGSLGPGTYAVRIRGVNAAGTGPATPDVFLTIPDGSCSPPSAPVLSTVLRNGSTVLAPWSAPATGQAEGYRLLAGSTPGSGDIAVLDVGPNTSYFQLAPPAGTYHVSIQALSSCGVSAASNSVAYVEPAPAVPGAPGGLEGTTAAASASLSWNPPVTGSGVTSYVLEAGFSPGATDIVLPLDSNFPAVSVGQVPAGTYYVRVRARNAVGTSDASNELTLVVP